MDRIIIKGLKMPVNIGLSEKERRKKQKIILECEISYDLTKAGESDSIKDTINYSEVCNKINELASEECLTLEALAHRIATSIKANFKAKQVKLLVKKPAALRRFKTKYAAVEVTR